MEAADFEPFFETRLQQYDSDRAMLSQEGAEQSKLISALRQANKSFISAHRGNASSKEREAALQSLENGYLKYKEIISNLDEARSFYNNLSTHLASLREKCKNFVYQRRIEAQNLEHDITTSGMSAMNLSSQTDQLKEQKMLEQQTQKYAGWEAEKAPNRQVDNPIPAPVPTRMVPHQTHAQLPTPGMWNPDMGIKFGATKNVGAQPPVQQPPPPQQQQGGQWDPSKGMNFRS
jgi:programmed cell death 6-interacting protein